MSADLGRWLYKVFGNELGKIALGYFFRSPPSDRLALARALVADMPGVVVAKVPPADVAPDEEYGLTEFREGRRVGFNAAISAIITAGSATDV